MKDLNEFNISMRSINSYQLYDEQHGEFDSEKYKSELLKLPFNHIFITC